MRRSSLAAAAFMILSGAAMAQVAQTPDAKDEPAANMAAANTAMANAAAADGALRNDTTGNDQAPTATDQKTEAASPRR